MLVVALAAVALVLRDRGAPPARAAPFHVSVTATPTGGPIDPGFLGLSLEYRALPQITGPDPASVDPVLVALMRELSSQPVLRIGGQSADRSWWPVPHVRRPLGITYDLTPGWANAARALARGAGARLILGIELEANQPQISSVEAQQLVSRIGRPYVAALEPGNEPELYSDIPWYRTVAGRPIPWFSRGGTKVLARPRSYGPRAFLSEFSGIVKMMPPGVPIAGPDTGTASWLNPFRPLISASSPVRVITFHAYGANECVKDPRAPAYPSVPHLLSLTASRGIRAGVQPLLSLAHRAGASFRIDEMNSVSCNGKAGVSDTFASALWATDALFTLAAAGVDGVNLHTFPGADNGLFDLARRGSRWTGTVHPLYYGALMFARSAPPGARLLALHTGPQNQIRAWATTAPDRSIRVLLINSSMRSSARVSVQAPLTPARATLERMLAPSAYAKDRVSIGGRSFGSDGSLGASKLETPPVISGAYDVSLPAASAALLTLMPGN